MSRKIEVVAYANGDDLSNLLDDRTAVVVGVADGWRSTGLVRHIDHQVEVNRLYEWARANQQLAQSAMDKLEEALADCDNLKMHLADHRTTLDALSLGVDPTAPAVERQESKRPKWMDEQFAMAARGERQTVVGTIADLSAEIDRLNGVVAEAVSLLDLQSDELCKRRFRIADLEAEVNTAPFEAKLISAGFGYPMSKEDAVKAYKASLQPRTDHPGNEDCEWCHGCGHDPYGNPCAGCCSPPAPVAVVTPQQLIDAIQTEQSRLTAEDYLMDSDDCIAVIREVACLDKVKEMNR